MNTFNKGDNIVATNLMTNNIITFICPCDKMCKYLLKRYVYMELKEGSLFDGWLFVKKE